MLSQLHVPLSEQWDELCSDLPASARDEEAWAVCSSGALTCGCCSAALRGLPSLHDTQKAVFYCASTMQG